MKNGWYAFGLLLAACTGAAAKQALIPPAAAGADVQKWDYFCMHPKTGSVEGWAKKLKESGAQGWEIASVAEGDLYCFKRPL